MVVPAMKTQHGKFHECANLWLQHNRVLIAASLGLLLLFLVREAEAARPRRSILHISKPIEADVIPDMWLKEASQPLNRSSCDESLFKGHSQDYCILKPTRGLVATSEGRVNAFHSVHG